MVGSWTNSAGTVWTLRADRTFEADVKANKPFRTWGTYSVAGHQLTVFDKSPNVPKPCRQPGVYTFHRAGNVLHFSLVNDPCTIRARQVSVEWHKISR